MKKKLLVLAFALTMLFGASMTVCADDVTDNSNSTIQYTGSVKAPAIKVTITKGTQIIVNPYNLVDTRLGLVSSNTVSAADIVFENKGETTVAVELTGKVSGNGITAATQPVAPATVTTKSLYIRATVYNDADKSKQLQAYAATKPTDAAFAKQLVYTTGAGAKMAAVDVPVLAKYESGGSPLTVAADRSATIYVKFDGWSKAPETSVWTANDKVDIITIYNLKVVPDDRASYFKAPNP